MKISEIVRITGLTASTIRFYEKIGLIREIAKDEHNQRIFSDDDKRWIKFLASIKNARLSINEMMAYAELYYSKNESIPDRLAVTEQCKEKLISEINELQEGIRFLDSKIKFYKDLIDQNK
ncbi:MAG: MerR family transcriptional regulator [Bacillota bacterium]